MSASEIFPVWKECYRIRQDDVDRNANLRMDSFFHFMQDGAVCHADHLGCGMEALRDHHLMWVLSRLKLSVHRTPRLGETILLETWPSGVEKLFAVREFCFYAPDGTRIASGTSCWLLLDSRKFRPVRILENLPCRLPDNSEREHFFHSLEKLARPEKTSDPISSFIQESSIDVNQHLNNTRYTTHSVDWLAFKTKSAPLIREIQVNFVAATPVYATLNTVGCVDGTSFYTECIGGIGTENLLRCQVSGSFEIP